jgi:hypothetical protein
MADKRMTKHHAYLAVFCVALLASCLALAQQAPPNPQGAPPAAAGRGGRGQGEPPSQSRMTFFVTSVGMGKGGDLGGLAGADASTQARLGQPAVNARDRIGTGPWNNYSYAQLGQPQNAAISQDLGELHGDMLIQAQRGSNMFKQSARNEMGEVINGVGDRPPNQHDILTGAQTDGRAFTDNADHTCNNWTSSGAGSAQVGHSDRIGNDNHSWNSSHSTSGCSQAALESTGGAGLFYCFAIN